MTSSSTKEMPASLVWLMAISAGVVVANIYYIQPLLVTIAQDFQLTSTQAGLIATATQIGTSFGMLLFVPLGDVLERRSLITRLVLAGGGGIDPDGSRPLGLLVGRCLFRCRPF